jgi:hypothetical protein
VAYAEIGNPALDLGAQLSRLADPPGPELTPDGGQRMLPPRGMDKSSCPALSLGSTPLALAAELLHAGADRGEVVSSTGPVHVCSSHVGRSFEASDRLIAAERKATRNGLTAWRKPRSHQARHPTCIGQLHTGSTP